MTQTVSQPTAKRFSFQTLLLLLIPILLLIGVIVLFLSTGGGLDLLSLSRTWQSNVIILKGTRSSFVFKTPVPMN
jgi:hypothetical protein